MPVCKRASSDIMVWFHGGSNTNSTFARATVGTICTLSRTSWTRTSPIPQPGAVKVIFDIDRARGIFVFADIANVDQP